MSFQISKSYDLLAKAMDYRALRADMISSNIANIDTPGYKARDIAFEEALKNQEDKLYAVYGGKLKLAKTNSMHLNPLNDNDNPKATLFLRDGQDARNDGNTVDLDVETTELAKNKVMYDALTAALKKDSAIFKSVIEYSSKV
jgi:flagellar basal-body rod protein FlgB